MAMPDHYGRFMGKRFDGEYFVNHTIKKGTHGTINFFFF